MHISDMNKKDDVIFLENGDVFDVPEEGSLGLLALGARGIIAWRNKREEVKYMQQEKKKAKNKDNE